MFRELGLNESCMWCKHFHVTDSEYDRAARFYGECLVQETTGLLSENYHCTWFSS